MSSDKSSQQVVSSTSKAVNHEQEANAIAHELDTSGYNADIGYQEPSTGNSKQLKSNTKSTGPAVRYTKDQKASLIKLCYNNLRYLKDVSSIDEYWELCAGINREYAEDYQLPTNRDGNVLNVEQIRSKMKSVMEESRHKVSLQKNRGDGEKN